MSKFRFELELFGKTVLSVIEREDKWSIHIMKQHEELTEKVKVAAAEHNVLPTDAPTGAPPEAPAQVLTQAAVEADDDLLSLITVGDALFAAPENVETAPVPTISFTDELEGRQRGSRYAQVAKDDVDIRVVNNTLANAIKHGQTDRREVGGFCMGKAVKEQDRWYVTITDTFPAKHAISRPASFSLTPDTWSDAHKVVEAIYTRGEYIVGWYHTHPGFGVFFSSMDHFVHENYFTQPWHVALVIDPYGHDESFFAWCRAKTGLTVSRCRHSVIATPIEEAASASAPEPQGVLEDAPASPAEPAAEADQRNESNPPAAVSASQDCSKGS